jgi:hypothetical protein
MRATEEVAGAGSDSTNRMVPSLASSCWAGRCFLTASRRLRTVVSLSSVMSMAISAEASSSAFSTGDAAALFPPALAPELPEEAVAAAAAAGKLRICGTNTTRLVTVFSRGMATWHEKTRVDASLH